MSYEIVFEAKGIFIFHLFLSLADCRLMRTMDMVMSGEENFRVADSYLLRSSALKSSNRELIGKLCFCPFMKA